MAKYKSVLVTAKILVGFQPCPGGLAWFKKTFPKGVRISNSQDEMNDLLASLDLSDDYTRGYLTWFINRTRGHEDLWAYAGDATYGTEFRVVEGGAFLSDCILLKDKK